MLLGFKPRFSEPIIKGTKKFTIRNKRKNEPKIGERLHMYTGLRTKNCHKITDKYTLTGIQLVDITITKINTNLGGFPPVTNSELVLEIIVDNRKMKHQTVIEFIKADGFEDVWDFATYWITEHGDKTEYFMEGQRKPKRTTWHVNVSNLIMYHWTDLRF